MGNYFCGWYFRCQNEKQTVAVIPAFHTADGEKSCSIQVITEEQSWNVPFPGEKWRQEDDHVRIGPNSFGREGMKLAVHTKEVTVTGDLRFGTLAPVRYDIMGPFRYVPFMECRHSVVSMKHRVDGRLTINGERYEFRGGTGYIEGDRGNSFPKKYLWTQCSFPEGAMMLSVAEIPFCGMRFTGVICSILWKGTEHRIATYLGARTVKLRDGEVVIRQGKKQLTVRRLEEKGLPLAAPVSGSMTRTIHETAACRVYVHYRTEGRTVFEREVPNGAFEYEYPQ